MKKIGIITLYDNINTGNKLQNYAVQCFFGDMGYKCETIRHWEMAHKKIKWWVIKDKVIEMIGFPKKKAAIYRLKTKRKKIFSNFSNKHLTLGEEISIYSLPVDFKKKYDYFVTGSDQVWHNWTNTEAEINYFMLKFADVYQRITIAPSFGKSEVESCFSNIYAKGLENIPFITCREEQGANIIRELTGKEAQVILDPTMLIDESNWIEIEKKPVNYPDKGYILLYALGDVSDEVNEFLNKIIQDNNYLIVDIFNENIPELYITAPDEFIYYVHHANLVVTDSFHACAFSILFKTNFIVFNRKTTNMKDMTSRLDTLLQTFNLSKRKFGVLQESEIFETDFSGVSQKLERERIRTRKIYCENFKMLDALKNSLRND